NVARKQAALSLIVAVIEGVMRPQRRKTQHQRQNHYKEPIMDKKIATVLRRSYAPRRFVSRASALLALTAFLALKAASALAQGSLTPPGPPGPTMKTLDQIEPRTPISLLPHTITVAGSYYVTRNLTGAVNQSGISIAASDVTLDLNGFTLTGQSNSPSSGISVDAALRNLHVHNGTLRNWGVGLYGENGTDLRVENVRALD